MLSHWECRIRKSNKFWPIKRNMRWRLRIEKCWEMSELLNVWPAMLGRLPYRCAPWCLESSPETAYLFQDTTLWEHVRNVSVDFRNKGIHEETVTIWVIWAWFASSNSSNYFDCTHRGEWIVVASDTPKIESLVFGLWLCFLAPMSGSSPSTWRRSYRHEALARTCA